MVKGQRTLVVRDRSSVAKDQPEPEIRPLDEAEARATSAARAASVAKSEVELGDTVGSYKLLELLGEGAAGRVFAAEHTLLGRRVALKMLHPKYSHNRQLVRRFFSEARTVTQIEHENIVSITDFVVSDEHPSFYIMELLSGQTLAERMEEGPPLALDSILDIGIQLCSALSAAHQKGVIHRDIKPANIFLTQRKDRILVKLLDFGVAKLSKDQGQPITKVGTLVGTPDYMSPEATFGLELDGRADVYALGIVLYEMLTGVLPFQGDSLLEVLELHREALPESARTTAPEAMIPEALDGLLLRCLSKKPEDRPGSVDQVQAELASLRAPQTAPTTVPITITASDADSEEAAYAESLAPSESLLSRALPTIAGVLLLAVAAAALFLWSRPQRPVKRAAAPIEIPTKKAAKPLRLPEVQLAPKTVAPPAEVEANKLSEAREAPEEKAPPKAKKRRRKRRRSKASSPSKSAPKRKTAPGAPPVVRKAAKPTPTDPVKPANPSKGKPIEKSGINRSDTLNPFQEKK